MPISTCYSFAVTDVYLLLKERKSSKNVLSLSLIRVVLYDSRRQENGCRGGCKGKNRHRHHIVCNNLEKCQDNKIVSTHNAKKISASDRIIKVADTAAITKE